MLTNMNKFLLPFIVGATFFFGAALALTMHQAHAQGAQAAKPIVSLSSSGSSAVVTAGDPQTTGFDIYVDGDYTMSFTLDSLQTPISFGPAGAWCEITAAGWLAGGLGHSSKAEPITNTSDPSCASGTGIVGQGVCVDSTAYDAQTGAILSATSHCY